MWFGPDIGFASSIFVFRQDPFLHTRLRTRSLWVGTLRCPVDSHCRLQWCFRSAEARLFVSVGVRLAIFVKFLVPMKWVALCECIQAVPNQRRFENRFLFFALTLWTFRFDFSNEFVSISIFLISLLSFQIVFGTDACARLQWRRRWISSTSM